MSHPDQLRPDQLRADALRWILTIADHHTLPVPGRIETYQADTGWRLQLHLDDDQHDAVRRWADVLDLPMETDMRVNGLRESWTVVSACGTANQIVFAGWDSIRIDTYCDYTTAATVAAA